MTATAKKVRQRIGLWRWLWRISAVMFASVVVLLALAIGLFRVALPLMPDYQLRIENAVTKAIGYPLRSVTIDARWRLQGPELLFKQVSVLGDDREETLVEADRLSVIIDLVALLRKQSIQPAKVVLSGMQLHVQRDSDGQYFVQNKAVSRTPASDKKPSVKTALHLPNGRFILQNIDLRYTDEHAQARPVTFSDIDVEVVIRKNKVTIDGALEVPGGLGRRLNFTVNATGDINDTETLQWQSYLKASGVDIEQLLSWWPLSLPITVTGNGGLSLWFGGTGGQLGEASIQFSLRDVMLLGGTLTEPLVLAKLGGRYIWEADTERWRVHGKDVVVQFPDHSWPQGDIELTMQAYDKHVQYSLNADYLGLDDLGTALRLFGDSPRVQAWQRRAPGGEISRLSGFAKVQDNAVIDYGITADGKNLSLVAGDGMPGFRGVDAHVFGGKHEGGMDIRSAAALLEVPGVFRQPLELSAGNMKVRWQQSDDGSMQTRINNIRFVTDDLTMRGSVYLERKNAAEPLTAEMDLKVEELRVAGASKYMPVNRLSPQLLKWLDTALVDGSGAEGKFHLRGPLDKFPFRDPADGEFWAEISLRDTTLRYSGTWPDATGVNATLRFERGSLRSTIESADLVKVRLLDGRVEIPDFKQPLVILDARTADDLAVLREYIDATPLVAKWGKEWGNFAMRGESSAQIHLELATRNPAATRYAINLTVDDGELQYRDWPQVLTTLRGEIKFADTGMSGENLTGTLLGEQVNLEIKPPPGVADASAVNVLMRGRARSESLGEHLQASFARVLSGDAEWIAQMRVGPPANIAEPFTIRLQTPLESMQVNLPRPFAKTAAEPRFLDASISIVDEGVVETVIEYGGDTNIHALFTATDDRWQVQRGEVRIGGGAALLPDEDTVRVVGKVEYLDISEVLDFTAQFAGNEPWVELQQVDLGISALHGFGQSFAATDFKATYENAAWFVTLLGERVSGSITVPDDRDPENPISGKFTVLHWASDEEPQPLDPGDTPSLRITADDFHYDQYQLGAMQLHVEARANIVALREFKTVASGFETRATGSWSFGESGDSTYVIAELDSTDVRSTLQSLQLAEFIDSDSASARLELTWPDGWSPDYLQTVEGRLELKVGAGTLRSVDPGAGRVFGLLSIGALPRRLGLDFRDVFGSGFGFDAITGDFELRGGSAYTQNLALQGPAANVGIVGRTGLVAKDYDQTAIVYANFGSSLPLAGTLAGGPAVGAALLIFSELFRSPLRQMGQVSYQITGSWDEPEIIKTGSVRPPEPESAESGSEAPPAPGAGE